MNDHRFLRNRQTGVAAVEFALVAIVMLLLFMGIFIYWHVLQTQQSVTRAAGDGVRHVHELLFSSRFQNIDLHGEAHKVIEHSLKQSGLVLDHLTPQELANLVALTPPENPSTLIVTYPIQLFPGSSSSLLNPLGVPKQLQSQSVIQRAP